MNNFDRVWIFLALLGVSSTIMHGVQVPSIAAWFASGSVMALSVFTEKRRAK